MGRPASAAGAQPGMVNPKLALWPLMTAHVTGAWYLSTWSAGQGIVNGSVSPLLSSAVPDTEPSGAIKPWPLTR